MAKSRAIVITGNGTNCEMEAAHACRVGGFDEAVIAHISELLSGAISLDDFHFLNLTGGFLDGDDLGSAKAQANRLKNAVVSDSGEKLVEQFTRFIGAGKLILGVCNGFQLMVKMGMLPGFDHDYLQQRATLMHNDCGRFQDRWCYLQADPASPSIYTRGIGRGIYLPVRHGEGKFVCDTPAALERLEREHLAVFKYADKNFTPTMAFPENPNGSSNAIAGICDPSGRLMGLMPHPEAFVHYTQHPRWTREELPEQGDGLLLYKNAADYVKRHLLSS